MRALSFLLVGLSLAACRSNDRDTDQSSSPRPTDWEASEPSETTRTESYPAKTTDDRDVKRTPWNDDEFVRKAIQGGSFEVESSHVALEKASSGGVKAFAKMMVEDHEIANQNLDALARRKRVTLPADMGAALVEKIDELKKLEGPEFDRAYTECQLKAHEEAIALFERATREARDSEIRDFAVKTLPSLRKHRNILEDVQGSWTREEEQPPGPGAQQGG